MATAQPSVVDSETETECSVCHEEYTEPKLLPCAHVLCRHCLVSWLSANAEHQCPLCRCAIFAEIETQQTDHGNLSKMVDSLPTYATLAALIKCMRILSQDHMCGGCQQSAAVSICLHCSEMLCSFCQNSHKRLVATRHHKVEDLATMTAERLAASQLDHCAAHQGNPSQFFCQNHLEAFCSLCATTKHRSCSSLTELEKAAGKSREELTELLSALLQGKQSIEEAVSELDRQIDDIEKHSQRTITEIDKLFDQLENSLKTRRKRVKEEELEAKHKAKNSALAIKTLLLDQRAKLMSNHRVVSCVVKSATDHSLCEISPSLKAQMEHLNTSSELPPHTEPVVEVTCTIDPEAIARIEQTVSELCQFTLTPTTAQSKHLTPMPRWRFQPKHGRDITLSEDRMTAQMAGDYCHSIVVADQAMMANVLFEVQILSETDFCYFPCGAVQETADGFTLPDTALNGWDSAVVFSHSNFICGRKIANRDEDKLRHLPKGTRVGVMLDSDRHLHLFIDGQDTDVIDWKLTSPCFAFFDLCGPFWETRIGALPPSYIPLPSPRTQQHKDTI